MERLLLAALVALSPLIAKSAIAQEEDDDYDIAPPPPPPDDARGPVEAGPPAQPPSRQAFERQLSPYGRWIRTPEYGRVWIPAVDAGWQPYADGRWVDTPYGWAFEAAVPWGPVVFHYGRWGWRAGIGWFWVPGYRWAASWVSWRSANGYACWSPLAPRGFAYGRSWPGWVVVPHAHFAGPVRRWMVPPGQIGAIVRSARPIAGFPSYRGHRFGGGRGGGGHDGWGRGRGHEWGHGRH